MDTENTSTTQYKPVTVDVPEDRLAEFHAFFSRFLAGPRGRGRGVPGGDHQRGRHPHPPPPQRTAHPPGSAPFRPDADGDGQHGSSSLP